MTDYGDLFVHLVCQASYRLASVMARIKSMVSNS